MFKHIENFLIAICFTIAIGAIVFLAYLFPSIVVSNQNRQAQKEKFIKDSCEVVGFYGRSGKYKTYKCNGRLYNENDL